LWGRNEKRPERGVFTGFLAEAVRFELTDPFGPPVFKLVGAHFYAAAPCHAQLHAGRESKNFMSLCPSPDLPNICAACLQQAFQHRKGQDDEADEEDC
jgi:hypothetical protein